MFLSKVSGIDYNVVSLSKRNLTAKGIFICKFEIDRPILAYALRQLFHVRNVCKNKKNKHV